MFRVGHRPAVALFLACAACKTPGYAVSVTARHLEAFDDRLLLALEGDTRSKGFEVEREHEVSVGFPEGLISSYSKLLSERSLDRTSIMMVWSGIHSPNQTLSVDIVNRLRGAESPVREQIDALGEAYFDTLVKSLGRDHVTIERRAASVPLIY